MDEWSHYLTPPYASTTRTGTILPFPHSHNLGGNKSSNHTLQKGGTDPPSCNPNASDQPPVTIYTIHKGNWWESSPPWQVNDFRVSAIGANALSASLLYTMLMCNVCFRSGLMGVFCLPAIAFGLTIMINSRTKLSWLLVRRVLEIPKLEVARAALSVGVSFRRHLVQLVLINNNGLFHSVWAG